jgi:hypothetical protein
LIPPWSLKRGFLLKFHVPQLNRSFPSFTSMKS